VPRRHGNGILCTQCAPSDQYDDGAIESIARWAPTQVIKLLNSKEKFAAALDLLAQEQQVTKRKDAQHKKVLERASPPVTQLHQNRLHACTHTCTVKNYESWPAVSVG
jgi:hypothetical protein